MERINRIISSVVVTCFLFNTAVSDVAFGQSINPVANSHKLAQQTKFSNLQDMQAKDIGDIELWFMACLNYMDGHGFDIAGQTADAVKLEIEKFTGPSNSLPGRTIFKPKDARFFTSEIRTDGDMLRMKALRHDLAYGTRNYIIEYSASSRLLDVYPEKGSRGRTEKDAGAINRYKQQEKVDAILDYAHKKNFTLTDNGVNFDYSKAIGRIISNLRLNIDNPGNMIPLENRQFHVVILTDEIGKMLEESGIDLEAKNGAKQRVIPIACSSNNTVHIFLHEADISALNRGGANKEFAAKHIMDYLVHEVGVMLGLPILRFIDGRPVNEIDERYNEYIVRGSIARLEPKNYSIANLDTNLATRDYAAGKRRTTARNKVADHAPTMREEEIVLYALYEILRTTIRWGIRYNHSDNPAEIESYMRYPERAAHEGSRIYYEVMKYLRSIAGASIPRGFEIGTEELKDIPNGLPDRMLGEAYKSARKQPEARTLFDNKGEAIMSENAAYRVLDAIVTELRVKAKKRGFDKVLAHMDKTSRAIAAQAAANEPRKSAATMASEEPGERGGIAELGRAIADESGGQYQLLVPDEFFLNKQELEDCQRDFGNRFILGRIFGLGRVSSVDPGSLDDYIDQIIAQVKVNNMAIALVPQNITAQQRDALKNKGIRYIPVTDNVMQMRGLSKALRGDIRTNTFSMMYAVRYIKPTDRPGEAIYETVKRYIEERLQLPKGMSADEYIDAIVNNLAEEIIRACLAPIEKFTAEAEKREYDNRSYPLIFA